MFDRSGLAYGFRSRKELEEGGKREDAAHELPHVYVFNVGAHYPPEGTYANYKRVRFYKTIQYVTLTD